VLEIFLKAYQGANSRIAKPKQEFPQAATIRSKRRETGWRSSAKPCSLYESSPIAQGVEVMPQKPVRPRLVPFESSVKSGCSVVHARSLKSGGSENTTGPLPMTDERAASGFNRSLMKIGLRRVSLVGRCRKARPVSREFYLAARCRKARMRSKKVHYRYCLGE
jgi:hypothetical protein